MEPIRNPIGYFDPHNRDNDDYSDFRWFSCANGMRTENPHYGNFNNFPEASGKFRKKFKKKGIRKFLISQRIVLEIFEKMWL